MNKREFVNSIILPIVIPMAKICKEAGIEVNVNFKVKDEKEWGEQVVMQHESVELDLSSCDEEVKEMAEIITPDEFYKRTAELYRNAVLAENEARKAQQEAAAALADAEAKRLEAETALVESKRAEDLAREEDARLSVIEADERKDDNGNRNSENTGGELPFGSGAGGAPDKRG